MPGGRNLKRLSRAAHPWLRQSSCLWCWLSRPLYLSLRWLSNHPHLLWLSSHPCPIPCCLWPPLRPLNLPMTFLRRPSRPLPLLPLQLLSRPWLLVQPSYLVARLGKPLFWLCLPATGARIVAAHSWMGECCGQGSGCITATWMTMAFSGLTYPPASPFQTISS